MNDRASQHQPSDDGQPRAGGRLPRDLRGVAQFLDRAGDDASRRLGPDALDRIFAASDLQRPLGLGEVSPVAARLGPLDGLRSRRRSIFGPLARLPRGVRALALAAALSMAILSAMVVYLATRPSAESLRDGAAGETVLADGGSDRALDGVFRGAPTESSSTGLPEHFDEALGGTYAVTTRSQPLGEVVVAFAGGTGFPRADLSRASLDAGGGEVFDAASFLDAGGATYDDLSGEMAAILASTGGLGR
ncbi:MAG: hypothetical protein GC172_10395 [Phycisphaera sp.]|nr:hypothetical protein [Phycisphaera sp.]